MIDIDISCKFINASQRRVYQRSVYIHEGLSQELEGQFTITEKSISVPVNKIYKISPQNFKNLKII